MIKYLIQFAFVTIKQKILQIESVRELWQRYPQSIRLFGKAWKYQ